MLPTADLHDARLRYPGVQHSLRRRPPQVVHQEALVHSRHSAAAPPQLVEALHRTVIQTSREDQIIRLLALHQFAQHRDQPHAPGPERNDASLHVLGGVCVQMQPGFGRAHVAKLPHLERGNFPVTPAERVGRLEHGLERHVPTVAQSPVGLPPDRRACRTPACLCACCL